MSHFQLGLTRDFLNAQGEPAFGSLGVELLAQHNNIRYSYLEKHVNPVQAEQLEQLDGVISLTPRYNTESLAGAKNLLVISRYGVGYDMVDIEACTNADVAVTITPQGVRKPVAYSILTLMLALIHQLPAKSRLIQEKRWDDRTNFPGGRITGQTLGSVGLGNIAKEMFRMASGFEMKHIAYDPFISPQAAAELGVELVSLEELCERSDFIAINCLLTKKTFHLITETHLKMMKPTAFLINTARGGIVDEAALITALQQGWIQGAGLDVFEEEPFVSDSPLLTMNNVIITPHSLCWTKELYEGLWRDSVQAIVQTASGLIPQNVVNKEVLSKDGFLRKLEKFKR